MKLRLLQIVQSALIGSSLLISRVQANEVTIFDVRRPIAMSDHEKTYKDFYLNGGIEMGLKKGVILTVQRRVPLYNTLTNSSAGDLNIEVAKIKIIHVQNRLSVARLLNEPSRAEIPILEDSFILIGDRVDLGSATAEADGPSGESAAKEKAAFAPQESKEEPAPQALPTPPIDKTVSVDLKVETLQKPTILDNKSVERQTATLDNPTLQ